MIEARGGSPPGFPGCHSRRIRYTLLVPFTYSIDEDNGLATVVWTGDVTIDAAEACIEATMLDPRYRPGFRRLVDMSNARFLMPKSDNRRLATTQGPTGHLSHPARGKVALLVGDELSFGVASQYAAYADLQGIPTEVFMDRTAAHRWLNSTAAGDTHMSGMRALR